METQAELLVMAVADKDMAHKRLYQHLELQILEAEVADKTTLAVLV